MDDDQIVGIAASNMAASADDPHQFSTTNNQETNMEQQQQITSGLFAVAEASWALGELGRCMGQLAELRRVQAEGAAEAREWLGMERRLRDERRGHQEELRAINQDINQLELLSRPLRQQLGRKKRELEAKAARVEAKMEAEEAAIDALGGGHPKAAEEDPPPSIAPGPIQLQLFLAFLHQLQLQQQERAPASSNNWMAAPKMPAAAPLPNPQQPKMKACQHCQRSIHRNAPTCPYCKKKITSKAAKRARK